MTSSKNGATGCITEFRDPRSGSMQVKSGVRRWMTCLCVRFPRDDRASPTRGPGERTSHCEIEMLRAHLQRDDFVHSTCRLYHAVAGRGNWCEAFCDRSWFVQFFYFPVLSRALNAVTTQWFDLQSDNITRLFCEYFR